MLKPVSTTSSMWDAFLDEIKTEFVPTEADAVPLDDLFAFDNEDAGNNVFDDVAVPDELDELDEQICATKSLMRDCMWSSAHNNNSVSWSQQASNDDEAHQSSWRRSRNGSLSVSECAESMFKDVKDLLLSSSPSSLSKLLLHDDVFDTISDDSLTKKIRSRSNSNNNQCQKESNSNLSCNNRNGRERQANKPGRQHSHHVEAGRSLLRSKQHMSLSKSQNNCVSNTGVFENNHASCRGSSGSNSISSQGDTHSHHHCPNARQTIIDHCYFQPPEDDDTSSTVTIVSNRLGLLTPNDTSDDDDDRRSADSADCGSRKRKRLHGSNDFTDAIIRYQSSEHNEDNVENLSPFIDEWAAATCADDPTTLATRNFGKIRLERHVKAKKSKLFHVNGPNVALTTPSSSSSPTSSNPTSPSLRRTKTHRSRSTMDPKSQEIRASHNNMERLRRVDLRQHFEQLKELVPELCREERASKVTILNKAQAYCRTLSSLQEHMKSEKEREEAQMIALKIKLHHLRATIDGQLQERGSNRRRASRRQLH